MVAILDVDNGPKVQRSAYFISQVEPFKYMLLLIKCKFYHI